MMKRSSMLSIVSASSALAFASLASPSVVLAQNNPGYTNFGSHWVVEEAFGWRGTWNRRTNSPSFDAVYQSPAGGRETATITVNMSGNSVTARRQQLAPPRPGGSCDYRGTLSADRVSVTGTYSCSWAAGPFNWSARLFNVVPFQPPHGGNDPNNQFGPEPYGKVWEMVEDQWAVPWRGNDWRGTWTRIGTTNSYSYAYRSTKGQSDNGIAKITGAFGAAGGTTRYSMERTSSVSPIKCFYSGTNNDGTTRPSAAGGDMYCLDAAGQRHQGRWHSTIRR